MDITTEAVRVGLDVAQLRAQITSANIANTNVSGARIQRADFTEALAALSDAVEQPDSASRLAAITPETLRTGVHSADASATTPAALDDEVAQLNIDSVTYRALTEGLARRFALMQLAISGK